MLGSGQGSMQLKRMEMCRSIEQRVGVLDLPLQLVEMQGSLKGS